MPARALTSGEVPRFDVAEAVTPVGTAPCSECRAPIVDTYYEADNRVVCVTCRGRIAADLSRPSPGSVSRALALGVPAAAAGVALYFGLVAVTGYDATIALVLVGLLVGKAVRAGSGGRGGRRFQWLAAGLTYAAIAGTYVPFVTSGFGDAHTPTASATALPTPVTAVSAPREGTRLALTPAESPPATFPATTGTPAHLGALLLLAAAAPLLAGFGNLLGVATTLASVLLAWRMNRAAPMSISGPYAVKSGDRSR